MGASSGLPPFIMSKKPERMSKEAFNINFDPGSMIGAGVGAAIASKTTKDNILRENEKREQQAVLGGSYYKQINTLATNMRINFTPFSVLVMVKDGPRLVTIDTIDTSEMTDSMRDAYIQRDAEYFKNIVLNKVNTEAQMAEQMFARRIVQRQLSVNDALSKNASFDLDQEFDFGFNDLVDNICDIKSAFEENSMSKIAMIYADLFSPESVSIDLSFDSLRPFTKEAGILSQTLTFFGLGSGSKDLKEFQGKFLNPKYLMDHLVISYLPDRVLFIVDNNVITQLSTMDMNEESYTRFKLSDKDYFRKLFMSEMNRSGFEKKAAAINIFKNSEIHPSVYQNAITERMGSEWVNLDQIVLIKELEESFPEASEGISDIPLNKIFFIQLLNTSVTPFKNSHVFEKCVRSFNDRSIDFAEEEKEYSLGELVFALECMQEVTPSDDIFDNFSEAVVRYIAEVFEPYVIAFAPGPVVDSDSEKDFYNDINEEIMNIMDDKAFMESSEEAKANNRILAAATIKLVDVLRAKQVYEVEDIDSTVRALSSSLNVKLEDEGTVLFSVKSNLVVDIFLARKENLSGGNL